MPPRWSRVPTRDDADYRRLDDRMTFATHVAAFSALNSGMWFFRTVQKADWSWSPIVTSVWFAVLLFHAVYIFAIADYSETPESTGSK
ncbi:2TM domain-containing protein [filamentous cyanobacterium LEGE 11480]|uniref:2TM domain-containing protein n=1 Tax=Romeriopsis navalis LEGE 11480 TaxID=2777977 RepID=A0A928Z5D3_9CYAN|nr:2TM domain-containing protein [Romeriopsis navalis]MBE9032704.1 2TM domain-containing protein [Romeriopsis navalis LEGE 11480]